MLQVHGIHERIVHRSRIVDDDVAAQVGLFFIALDKELLGLGKELPVDMTRAFALVVEPVLGKLHRKPVKRTLVQARDKPFNHLFGQDLQVAHVRYAAAVYVAHHSKIQRIGQ